MDFINISDHSILINSNILQRKSLPCFKGFRFNKLEISISEAVDLVIHPDINPVQQGLTSVNRREPVFSL